MKRTVLFLTGMATLGVAAYIGSRLYAQDQNQGAPIQGQIQQTNAVSAAPATRTRIAVINLMGVVKNYDKWKSFEQTYKEYLKKVDGELEAKRQEMIRLKTQFDTAVDDTKTKLAEQLKTLERQVQDQSEVYKRELAKYRDDMSVQIYREIEDAVKVYARSQDIEMVMHFNDAIIPADIYHPLNVQRKLQTAACMPIYTAPGMDITNQVAEMLNARMRATNPTAPVQR